MNENFAKKIKNSKVWIQEFKNSDEVLDKGILNCEVIPTQNKAFLSIYSTGVIIEEMMSKSLEKFDLTIAQKSVLETLYFAKNEELSQNDISKYLFSSKANISGILNRLEEKKLITRKENKHNKREKIVNLTNLGRKKIDEIFSFMGNVGLDFISKDESNQLIVILKKIRNNMKEK